jgi:FtsP/CotA-like multicopper oxidase with cupredoxin domain
MNRQKKSIFSRGIHFSGSSARTPRVLPRSSTGRGRRTALLSSAVLALALSALISGAASATPSSPVDQSAVPHYFGPYPNWANSPLTVPDANVTISGDGSGAQAQAQVGTNGAITGIKVTNPGHGYTNATITVSGTGTGAAASAHVVSRGTVVDVAVRKPGSGYTHPVVKFRDIPRFERGETGSGATATAYGGIDKLSLTNGGSGYTAPTLDFDLPSNPNGVQASGHATKDANGTITAVVLDNPGSGYSSAPGVRILDGTRFAPATHDPATFKEATVTATLSISSVVVDSYGVGYTRPPAMFIADTSGRAGTGRGAMAAASINDGTITSIDVTNSGSGYISPGGVRKFVDTLPGLTPAGVNNLGQYLPVAQPDTTTFPNTDYYVIAVVQHREKMHSDLPAALLREYVQLSTSVVPGKQVALQTDLLDGSSVATKMPDGTTQAYAVDDPHYLGPIIVAQKDRAVRIVFYNLLPTGRNGDLFLPTDSTVMGSGMGPMDMTGVTPDNQGKVTDGVRNPECTTQVPKPDTCFKDNRATLHLHGGVTPWISDGTPHQWITPANQTTDWPQGVSVQNVPDMVDASRPASVPDCSANNDGCQTFYYTNQQSARLMFYHDHAWGITRLNVYAGEAAGYMIQDPTEKKLVDSGTIPSDQIPLIIQDRTFVPKTSQLATQDPTWDSSRWGSYGNLWYHHVYMPAQNPADPSGLSSFGRWFYGPWFWPPATDVPFGPIDNPYYNMDPKKDFTQPLATPCSLDDPSTWQYQTDPFCEPAKIPGTPNISAGMEQFNDTPLVNGTAYPTTTVDPKSYRFRILNAANDRFWNLQWYVADTTGTEVALKPAELAAAQTDPSVVPTPDLSRSPEGPNFIQIATEGGFLPAPVVVPNQPITWITDPTRFDWGNVDKHALALAPAERADAIVDFSKYAGKTLILYNDAPAAYPGRIPCYDYYTGDPDLSPACAPTTLPGYGPNTRTIMQVKVSNNPAAAPFDLTALENAFTHKADGSGVFESGQRPIIVGQAAYNSAYGTNFAASGDCSTSTPIPTIKCDGFARIAQQGDDKFTFDTLLGATALPSSPLSWAKLQIPLQPKAIHDETNSANFDEYGRMTANMGVEQVPATPGAQNAILYPYTFPMTEVIDASNLPVGDTSVTPISSATDGTQIWKITHNGVDTHPIHFHLYDVQVLNRVTWDNIIIPPDPTELGWKDTIRVSPLEDTIVALRPVIPSLPWEIPNSIRELSPMMMDGVQLPESVRGLATDPSGNPITISNHLVNLGWEYVWHCHILSHEEMDMMRPEAVAVAPKPPINVSFNAGTKTLSWTDNSIAETSYLIQKQAGGTGPWADLTTITTVDLTVPPPLPPAPPVPPNTTGPMSYADPTFAPGDRYQVIAQNTVGDITDYGLGTTMFPSVTAKSVAVPAP